MISTFTLCALHSMYNVDTNPNDSVAVTDNHENGDSAAVAVATGKANNSTGNSNKHLFAGVDLSFIGFII